MLRLTGERLDAVEVKRVAGVVDSIRITPSRDYSLASNSRG